MELTSKSFNSVLGISSTQKTQTPRFKRIVNLSHIKSTTEKTETNKFLTKRFEK